MEIVAYGGGVNSTAIKHGNSQSDLYDDLELFQTPCECID